MASPRVAPRSDGECELGEGRREPMPGVDVGSQLVVAATQVLDEGVPPLITCADRNRFRPRMGPAEPSVCRDRLRSHYSHLGYPFKRSRSRRWIVLVLARITRGRWVSCRRGSGPMWTVWTTWSGCAGPTDSSAPAAATPGAGGWVMAGLSALGARPARRRRRARSLIGPARR